MKKILTRVIIPILIIVIIVLLSLIIFKYKAFVVLSGCMEKSINLYDIVIIKKDVPVKKNDIIYYQDKNGKNIIHRIVDIDGNG